VPIVLGWGSTGEKLRRAARVVRRWKREGEVERLARIDLRFHDQVVVELRTAPAAQSHGAGGRRV
jgi:cell division septal protein FtsQ